MEWECACGISNSNESVVCSGCGWTREKSNNYLLEQIEAKKEPLKEGEVSGAIKWFSSQKGYGFITDSDGKDRYYGVTDIVGTEIPQQGDNVAFLPKQGRKGPAATQIRILEKGSAGDRVLCVNCGKKMVPRIITYQGSLTHSVCPFCGGTYKDFSRCYIATAVYKDAFSPECELLRFYRDHVLLHSPWGRMFVRIYYATGPEVAMTISRYQPLVLMLRKPLDWIVNRIGDSMVHDVRE